MHDEHPIKQDIESVSVEWTPDGEEFYRVGFNGVTRIEATKKSGMHADIPYIRVWKGDDCHSEHCQHNVTSVQFFPRAAAE